MDKNFSSADAVKIINALILCVYVIYLLLLRMIPPIRGLAASMTSTARKVWLLYYDGFRQMTIGKTLWVIILLKVFIFFVVIKLLFFPNILSRDYPNDNDRADHVRHELLKKSR